MADPGQWQRVTSSNLSRCRWDPETEQLQIQFQNGKTYSYDGVPASIYNGLLEAESPGRFFNQNIKGVYDA
jgi:hypothetical protein